MAAQTSSKEGDLSTLSPKLRKLKNKVSTAQAIVSNMGGTSVNHGRLLSVNRELEVYRKNLQDIEEELYLLRLPEEHGCIRKLILFGLSVGRTKLEHPRENFKQNSACKLRKLEIPSFNGNMMKWDHFWRRNLSMMTSGNIYPKP